MKRNEQWYTINHISVDRILHKFNWYVLATSENDAKLKLVAAAREYNHFYGYIGGDPQQPHWVKPFAGAHSVVPKGIRKISEKLVPGQFKQTGLFAASQVTAWEAF